MGQVTELLLAANVIHLAASIKCGLKAERTSNMHVTVREITPDIINTKVVIHSWGSSGVMQTSFLLGPAECWHIWVNPSRMEPEKQIHDILQHMTHNYIRYLISDKHIQTCLSAKFRKHAPKAFQKCEGPFTLPSHIQGCC